MAFQIRDETAGRNLVYIDNLGQMGLGSLPNSGQQLTVQGTSLVNTSGNFGCGIMPPGAQAGYEGSVVAPAGSTATVSVATSQIPTVTANLRSPTVSTTQVVFDNTAAAADTTVNYSIW